MRSNRLAAMNELIAASFKLQEYEAVSTPTAPYHLLMWPELATPH